MTSSETELFKDKIEVSLDGRQIFYLFFGGAVIATLVFVLGVMVGRQVESRAVAETGSPTTDPLAALDKLEGGSDLAFPAALRGDDVLLGSVDATLAGRTKIAQEQLAAAGLAEAEEAKQAESERVEADEATADDKKALAKAKAAADKAIAKEEAAKAKAEKAEKAAAASEQEEEPGQADPKPKRRRFTLQVGSFQDKEEADTFFRGLSGAYDPYMVEADVPGKGTYFRVRVGGYGSFDEAVAAKAEFEASQHVIAYVTRLK